MQRTPARAASPGFFCVCWWMALGWARFGKTLKPRQVAFGHFSPMLTVGWGNPIPRHGRRWSISFAMGFAYVGDPKVHLNFAGTACDSTGTYCAAVSQLPGFQSNLDVERQKLEKNANDLRFLPVISIGYALRF